MLRLGYWALRVYTIAPRSDNCTSDKSKFRVPGFRGFGFLFFGVSGRVVSIGFRTLSPTGLIHIDTSLDGV
jgi:hypothetical protein